MFVRSRLAAVALAATCAAAGLAGCSGSTGQPQRLPRLSTTPAATASNVPPATTDHALADATAVVREYFRLLNAETTLRTAERLRTIMASNCECRKVADSTAEIAARRQHYFGVTTVTRLQGGLIDPRSAEVLVDYNYTRSGIRTATGTVLQSSPGRHGARLLIHLIHQGGSWRISSLTYLQPGKTS